MLDTIPRLLRFLENESLCRVLDCLELLCNISPSGVRSYKPLGTLLSSLWEIHDAATLRADFTKLYRKFVSIIFHITILDAALENEELLDIISSVCIAI